MTKQRQTRQELQASNRRELLRAAGRRFLRDGFVATSLSDIAEEAGVTKGAVYSNFASKEDLFLALLQGPVRSAEIYAPSKIDDLEGDGAEFARSFGRYAESVRPSRQHVALFLETNAAALRSVRARNQVAGNTRAFAAELGRGLAEAFDAPHADAVALGLIAQSLYAGLLMHGAFLPEIDQRTFELAYETLYSAARGMSDAAIGGTR
jgi:AcrR family transcriptional regulator